MIPSVRRRSPRLVALGESPTENEQHPEAAVSKRKRSAKVPKTKPAIDGRKKRQKKRTTLDPTATKVRANKKKDVTNNGKAPNKKEKDVPESKSFKTSSSSHDILPRNRENALKNKTGFANTWIMGIDEAGRGPLAGPVVAAAAVVPVDIPGITDSKKITCETKREELYNEIVTSSDVTWAVAVVDAPRIDEINILQATMQAMSMAASALVMAPDATNNSKNDHNSEKAKEKDSETKWKETSKQPACASRKGCYVVSGGRMLKPQTQQKPCTSTKSGKSPLATTTGKRNQNEDNDKEDKEPDEDGMSNPASSAAPPPPSSHSYYALVDGNRIPKDLPCAGESIVKGDSKEYSIAAASILAKVTRDRLMHAYDELYPQYKLGKHKGYPTKDHMSAVFEFGASPIHRRTFAPLKHMEFDEDGKVVSS